MRAPSLTFRLAALLGMAAAWAAPAHAQWTDIATISSTIGNTPYRLCMGGGRTDIGCPADAPLLDRANNLLTVPTNLRVVGNLLVSGSQQFDGVTFANGGVSATGTISATSFSGNGSGITGIDFSTNPIDRIISGTTRVLTQQDSSITMSTAGTERMVIGANGYIGVGTNAPGYTFEVVNPSATVTLRGTDSALRILSSAGRQLYFGASDTAQTQWLGTQSNHALSLITNNGVRMSITSTGNVNIGSNLGVGHPTGNTNTAQTRLDVSGTLKIANGGESCDVNRAGAIKYENSAFYVCQNGTAWEQMATTSSNTLVSINTGLSGSIVFRDEYGYLKARNSFNISSTTGSVGIGGGPLTALGNDALYVAGRGYFGNRASANGFSTTAQDSGYAWPNNTVSIIGNDAGTNNYMSFRIAGQSAMYISSATNVGLGTLTPATKLDVSGTLKLATGNENCDASRAGAIKFESGQFQVCRNGTTWEYLIAGSSGSVDTDRITSGTTSVITHQDTSITLATAGLERMIVGNNGNIGIGTSAPATALDVSGTLKVSTGGTTAITINRNGLQSTYGLFLNTQNAANNNETYIGNTNARISIGLPGIPASTSLHIAGSLRMGAETSTTMQVCDANRTGAIKFESGQFMVCRNGTNWETMIAGANGNVDTDRITSGTTAVIANTNGNTVSVTTGGTVTSYFHGIIGLVTPGVSATGTVSSADVNTGRVVLRGVAGGAGVSLTNPGDNLGNHTATQNLSMNGNSIVSASNIAATGSVQAGNADTVCSTLADYGKMRFNPATKKMFMCRP